MPMNSLKKLLNLFPYFFDKSEVSNFYKSQSITNNSFKELYNDLMKIKESFHLNKRILIWKEQNEPYDYTMHFVSQFPLLKEIQIDRDGIVIYKAEFKLSDDESYSFMAKEVIFNYILAIFDDDSFMEFQGNEDIIFELMFDEGNIVEIPCSQLFELQEISDNILYSIEDNIRDFNYSLNWFSDDIIPSEKYKITVTTFDENVFEKGFPENDIKQGNVYDHDVSLDEIGEENNIPRRQYTIINEEEYTLEEILDRYSKTDPLFNNQSSEDDYHYMKRQLEYMIRYHTMPLPVLELWKLYSVESTLVNRDKYILRLFDENLHPPNADGEFDWIPEAWEHKDFFVDEENKLGEFFFVQANTTQPVKNQSITFYLKFMNSLAEILTSSLYTVDIFLNGELLEENYVSNQYNVTSELLSDSLEGNLFTFNAKKDNTLIKSIDILVKVRGCSDADFYVYSGSDSDLEEGSRDYPFKTLEKAIEKVNGIYNLIAVYGDVELEKIVTIPDNCTIIGCNNAKIINNIDSARFFHIPQNKTLTLQDITLTTPENTVLLENDVFINKNILNLNETLVTPTLNYGVLLEDLNANTFIKNMYIRDNKLFYTEMDKEELSNLSDVENVILNLRLNGDKLYYTEYVPASNNEYDLNLPYIHLDDRLLLVGAVEKLKLEEDILKSTEYGDDIAWQVKNHSI